MRNVIGKRVQEARRNFKPRITQEELAARLEADGWNINHSVLSKIEAGIRIVTDYELMALAKALKVSPESLLDKQVFEGLRKHKTEL